MIEIPMLPFIRDALEQARCDCTMGDYVLSTDHGRTHIANTTLYEWSCAAAVTVSIDGFEPKRIRSAVETQLAARGISQTVRGRLQSHGITGVQAVHYDGHTYLEEKRDALQVLHDLLNQKSGTVLDIKKRTLA